LFDNLTGYFKGAAVQEIINIGIPLRKIIVENQLQRKMLIIPDGWILIMSCHFNFYSEKKSLSKVIVRYNLMTDMQLMSIFIIVSFFIIF
jgi:hypothetical protein